MRRGAALLGLFALALVWLGPLLGTDRGSFTAHMLAHMGVIAIAAPLLGYAAAPLLRDRLPPMLAIWASLAEFVVVWVWHSPLMRELAEGSTAVTVAEQASFVAVGLLLWGSCFAGRPGVGAIALLFTAMHMTLLGALLALSTRPLFGGGEVTCLGFTLGPMMDQGAGGVTMLGVGMIVYLCGGLYLAGQVLAPGDPREAR